MQSLKRDLSFGLSLSTFVFVCALAWGSPFIRPAQAQEHQPPQAPPPQTQPDQPPQAQPDRPNPPEGKAPTKTFSGTVVKAGEAYVLRDGAGKIFKLDDSESARPFEGKAVKVTGQLDEQAMLIHVESIEGTTA
jgi:hypothetical protein